MKHHQNRVACIGWGSLIWDPRSLPCLEDWYQDGPSLPVEFARESAGGKITLVICKDVPRIEVLWTLLDANDVAAAKQQLGFREFEAATPKWIENNIGFWDRSSNTSHGEEVAAIASWAAKHEVDGVVWTNLDFGFKASRGVMPCAHEIVTHLRALAGKQREAAEEYVRRAPTQITTDYRRLIAAQLDWT